MGREWDDTLTHEYEERTGEEASIEQVPVCQEEIHIELLKQLLEKQKKQLFYSRIAAGSMVGFLTVVVIVLLIVVPKVTVTLSQINQVAVSAQETLKSADSALADISTMGTSVTAVSGEMETFILDNSETLTNAMEDISAIDFEGLNNAIQDLEDVVEPLANLMNGFKR